jgi:hypothetical protein
MRRVVLALAALSLGVDGLRAGSCPRPRTSCIRCQHSQGWDGYGKGPFKFYSSFESFMAPFPQEDRDEYPEQFSLPKGVYEVAIPRPLGIAFEEVEPGRGVLVDYLVDDGNAATDGVIQRGDILIAVTACKEFGPRFERKLIPSRGLEFDMIMAAIASNEPRWKCYDVVMLFERPSEADRVVVDEFMKFFEIPFDHVFRTG